MREPKLALPQLPQFGNLTATILARFNSAVRNRYDFHPAGWNESARAIAQSSRKRGSLVPSINSPGRSDG
jgi:hypothetical protein